MNNLSFPEAIEIQTTSNCNGKCVICPHKDLINKIPQGTMKMEVFKKIIDEIGGRRILVIPYLNAEPLMDAAFFDKLTFIKEKCVNASIEISSNISLLNNKKREMLRNYEIDELRLSVFGFTDETYSMMMPGLKWSETKKNMDELVHDKILRKNIKKVSLVMIDFEKLTQEDISLAENYCKEHNLDFNLWGFLDRAGNVDGYSNKIRKKIVTGCEQDRPLKRMHITFDGKVVLCCQDWKRQYVLGNVCENSLSEIWNSERYNKIREEIYGGTENAPELCKKCKLAK